VVVVSAPSTPARRRSSSPRRRARARGGIRRRVGTALGAAGLRSRIGGAALGGWGVGMVEKYFPNLPSLPVIGRKGAIALAVYAMQPKHKLLQDLGVAAAALSGYQFAKENKVTGNDDDVFMTA
jgi:hypothetical protein